MAETTVTVSNSTASTNPDYAVAVDEIAGREVQEVKLMLGAAGVNDGPVSSANPMPTSVASLPLPTGAATSAKQDTIIGFVDGVEGLLTTISGAVKSEDAASVSGDSGISILGVRNDSYATTTSNNGDYGNLSINSGGAAFVMPVYDGAAGDSVTPIKREDAASATSSAGFMVLSVRRDADGAQTSNDGDYAEFQTNSEGRLKTAAKLTDGTDTATIASAIDSRNGLDIQFSSIPSKSLIDFHSDDAAQRLLAGGTKVFSPGGTRSTYYDTDGYGLLGVQFTDNSSGASGGVLYIRWSRDGVNTAFNDPGDGTGGSNYTTAVNSTTDGLVVAGRLIPVSARYVNFVYIQGGSNQGSTYPSLCEFAVKLYPIGFTNAVTITNQQLPVVGAAESAATLAGQPVVIGGVDSISSPTIANALVVSSTGAASVDTELPAAAALADAKANPTTPIIANAPYVWNGTTWDRVKSAANALNSTGTGLPAAALVGQLDDVSPTAITENQFGLVRISQNRSIISAAETKIASATFTTATSSTSVDCGAGTAWKYFTVMVVQTGTVTAWDCRLEGSLDNTNFTTLITHTNADGSGVIKFSSTCPCRYFRARCASITLGAGTNVVVTIFGTQ